MKLNQWIRIVLISGGIIALTACSSARKNNPDQAAINAANEAYGQNQAQTAGLGEGSSFGGDQAGARQGRLIAKRIYYFDFDKSEVHGQDKPAINANAGYLLAHPRAKVLLEGHTDPRGSREYNIGLGERRAKAIAEILTAKGISPAQVRMVSYGAEKLATPAHTEAAYQLDRRVVLVYLQQ